MIGGLLAWQGTALGLSWTNHTTPLLQRVPHIR